MEANLNLTREVEAKLENSSKVLRKQDEELE
jgi:hypothetical protein